MGYFREDEFRGLAKLVIEIGVNFDGVMFWSESSIFWGQDNVENWNEF